MGKIYPHSRGIYGTGHLRPLMLSPLPLAQAPEDRPDEVELYHVAVMDTLPVTEKDLHLETNRDPF